MTREIGVDAVIDKIRLAEQGSNPSTPDSGYGFLFIKSDGVYFKDDEGNVTGPILDWPVIQASQLVNEIKGWPPIVQPDADLDALNLWWDKVGTPTTAPSVVDVVGEGITETYELCLKVVADAASEGLSQRWTYADEPRVKNGRKLSVLLAIWSVSSASVTAKLVNSDASNTAASAVTAAAWTIVEIPNHTLAGTYCELQVTVAAAGTFYVVPLGANIGARAFPLRARGQRYVDGPNTLLVNGADPATVWTDVDCTTPCGPLSTKVHCYALYQNSSATAKDLSARRNGDTRTGNQVGVVRGVVTGVHSGGQFDVPLDDANIFEYVGSDVAANSESIFIQLVGWWEWE